jgi:hypothetical protein
VKLHERHDATSEGDAPVEPSADTGLGIPDDHILGEISHEMGNYFHKLYYWTEYLRDRDGHGPDADRTAFDMLEGTVERLEHFMRMILEYFAPARLSFTRLRAEELVVGLGTRLTGRRLVIVGESDVRATPVLADAALIGHALRTVFEGAAATLIDEGEMVVRLAPSRRQKFQGIEIEFHAGRGAPAAKALARGIEMAVAEKFVQMHGGELFERAGDAVSPRALVVFLPIYA